MVQLIVYKNNINMRSSQNKIVDANLILSAILRLEKKIDRIDTQSNLNKDYLTTHESCHFLGCSRNMIWRLVKAGKLNKLKLENGRTYYATQELKNIIENTPAEIGAA